MIGWIEPNTLLRMRDNELYGLQKLYFRALSCPDTNPAELPVLRATLNAIESELGKRRQFSIPSP